jgi:hypothetical protein
MYCGGGHFGFPIGIKHNIKYADRKSKMAATAIHRLTLDPMGKCSNAFFSETTNMIKAKLYMDVHCMVLYNLQVFCFNMKFKKAVYVLRWRPSWISIRDEKHTLCREPSNDHSSGVDRTGKMFQNASSLKPLGQLKPNCP